MARFIRAPTSFSDLLKLSIAKAYIDTALILNRRHISRVLHVRLVGTELRVAAAHSSEGIETFSMATLYLLTELSRVSSVAIHDESDMVWDGSEREEEEQEGGGDGEEAVYEGGGEGAHGVRCKSYRLGGSIMMAAWGVDVIRNRSQPATIAASRDVSPNCPDPARPGQTTAPLHRYITLFPTSLQSVIPSPRNDQTKALLRPPQGRNPFPPLPCHTTSQDSRVRCPPHLPDKVEDGDCGHSQGRAEETWPFPTR